RRHGDVHRARRRRQPGYPRPHQDPREPARAAAGCPRAPVTRVLGRRGERVSRHVAEIPGTDGRPGGSVKPQKVLVPPPASVLLPAWAQPETRPAELIVRAWGENKPEAARAILELCEKPASALVNIEVTPPFRML